MAFKIIIRTPLFWDYFWGIEEKGFPFESSKTPSPTNTGPIDMHFVLTHIAHNEDGIHTVLIRIPEFSSKGHKMSINGGREGGDGRPLDMSAKKVNDFLDGSP